MIGGPIGRSVVYFGSFLCSSPYNNNPPCLCFSFIGRQYAYNRSYIKYGSCFFTIIVGFLTLRLLVQLMKCVTWSPHGLDHFISFLLGFLTPNLNFHILGAPVGSRSFIESFVDEVFHEDLGTISSLHMLVDP
jgi:hypothetical protein